MWRFGGATYNGGQGQVVEAVGEVLPDIGVAVLAETLVEETVNLGDLATLVVAPENGDAVGVPDWALDAYLSARTRDSRFRRSSSPGPRSRP